MTSIDTYILFWLNQHHVPGSIPFLQFISLTTTYVSISIVLIILALAFVRRSKEMGKKCLVMLVALLLSGATTFLIKSVNDKERPFKVHPEIVKRSTGGESSFPSGHTMEAFAMAMGIFQLFRQKKYLVAAMFVWATLVGYSRIALGVHFPSDVIAGVLFGLFVGWVIPKVVNRFFKAPETL